MKYQHSSKFFEAWNAYDSDQSECAFRLMKECAEAGDPVACFTVANWYLNGEGTTVDVEKGSYWLDRLVLLATQGNTEAQWELSSKYRWGACGLPVDYQKANEWLERAAENGCGDAQHHLALYMEYGQYNYKQDRQLAEDWYQRAFDQDHPETLYTFALREFKEGKITEKAITLLKRAADKGFKQAAHILHGHTH